MRVNDIFVDVNYVYFQMGVVVLLLSPLQTCTGNYATVCRIRLDIHKHGTSRPFPLNRKIEANRERPSCYDWYLQTVKIHATGYPFITTTSALPES